MAELTVLDADGYPLCVPVRAGPLEGEEVPLLIGPGAPDRLQVERALADWSLTGNRMQVAIGFLRKGRQLAPRLKTEAARRGQPADGPSRAGDRSVRSHHRQ